MHNLVAGETGSGKSRMMRERIVPHWVRAGRPVVVLDILRQPWGATVQTDDPAEFLATMKRSKGCIGVWDECGTMLDSDPALRRSMQYLATVSRNDGHLLYFLTQRLFIVPPTFRYQCSRAYLFRLRGRDATEAAQLYPEPGLETTLPNLLTGECIVIKPMGAPVKTRVF